MAMRRKKNYKNNISKFYELRKFLINKTMVDLEKILRIKKVLITGHTGFKGSWLTMWLLKLELK